MYHVNLFLFFVFTEKIEGSRRGSRRGVQVLSTPVFIRGNYLAKVLSNWRPFLFFSGINQGKRRPEWLLLGTAQLYLHIL